MKHPILNASPRTVLGKKVKKLRKEGFLPANVYGKNLPSTSLQVAMKDFVQTFKEVGETGLIDLMVDGQKHPVLVKNVQFEFRNHTPLHADFYEVNLKEKVKTMVPLELTGEALAVKENVGTLIQPASEVEVEALPESLPEKIEVNIENLAAIDDQLTVADLTVPEGVTILTEEGQVVAKIAEIVIEEEPEPVAEEGAEGEEGAESTEGDQEGSEDTSTNDQESSTEEKSEDN